VIINETLARLAWPAQDPLGRRFIMGTQTVEVVGLARDTRFRDLLASAPTIYVALAQADSALPILAGYLAVRSELPAERVAAVVQRAARELAADATVFETTSIGQAIKRQLARPRFSASLLIAFAGVTMLLVGCGLFATLAALVQQRTREIGIRFALGARPLQLGRSILGRGLAIAGIGLLTGLAASLLATRLIRRLLFGVQPMGPLVLLFTSVLITGIAVLACLGPSLRAVRVDPMRSLREE
jgi:predicted lysophospholipase L1 biosynthesis ABC-type transport system permease subunit